MSTFKQCDACGEQGPDCGSMTRNPYEPYKPGGDGWAHLHVALVREVELPQLGMSKTYADVHSSLDLCPACAKRMLIRDAKIGHKITTDPPSYGIGVAGLPGISGGKTC